MLAKQGLLDLDIFEDKWTKPDSPRRRRSVRPRVRKSKPNQKSANRAATTSKKRVTISAPKQNFEYDPLAGLGEDCLFTHTPTKETPWEKLLDELNIRKYFKTDELKYEGKHEEISAKQMDALRWLFEKDAASQFDARDRISMLQAHTGTGKTIVELISAIKDLENFKEERQTEPAISVIVTSRINLTTQHAYQEAQKILNTDEVPVEAISSGNKRDRDSALGRIKAKGQGVIVITPQTLLAELRKPDSIIKLHNLTGVSIDEGHHLGEGKEKGTASKEEVNYENIDFAKNDYGQVLEYIAQAERSKRQARVPVRLFSATMFKNKKHGEAVIDHLHESFSKRPPVGLKLLDVAPPNIKEEAQLTTQVQDHWKVYELFTESIEGLAERVKKRHNRKKFHTLVDSIAGVSQDPLDDTSMEDKETPFNVQYANYLRKESSLHHLEAAPLYAYPKLMGMVKYARQCLNEPAKCLEYLFALAAFAFQDVREIKRENGKVVCDFNKKFTTRNGNEEHKKRRIEFVRRLLRNEFKEPDGSLYKAFISLATKTSPETFQRELIDLNSYVTSEYNFLYYFNRIVKKQRVGPAEGNKQTEMQKACNESYRTYIESTSRATALRSKIDQGSGRKTLVFYNNVTAAGKIVAFINETTAENAVGYTGDMSEKACEEMLEKFNDNGEDGASVLVMTSRAGEGKHLKDAEQLIVCSCPNTGQEYLQLIGRVGREGKEGKVIYLMTYLEYQRLQRIKEESELIEAGFKELAEVYDGKAPKIIRFPRDLFKPKKKRA